MNHSTRMHAMKQAHKYAMKQARQLIKLSLEEFFIHVHAAYYSDQDISFMKYFLELTQHEEEFVVPHTKLHEFGIMSSTRSGDVLTKLNQLDLENEVDYLLRDISQQVKSGTKHSKQYMLTPEAFKLSLMSAKKYPGQTVNPLRYRKYYLLLEKVFKLYTDYEREYSKCLLAMKDDKIDLLRIDNQQLKADMQKVLAHTTHIIGQNDQLNIKFDTMFEYLLSFARMTIPTWIGSSIIQQQFNTLARTKSESYALGHLKLMYYVGFYINYSEAIDQTKIIGDRTIEFRGRGYLVIYACCTNFADIAARIKQLYDRHTEANDTYPIMRMLQPKAITLISCEVNSERIILENSLNLFPENSTVSWDPKHKSFNIIVDTRLYSKAQTIFASICTNATNLRFQDYQQRIDRLDQITDATVDPKIIKYIDDADIQFFSSTRPFCQKYLNSYLRKVSNKDTNSLIEYCYGTSSRKCAIRPDLDDANLSANDYALQKIKLLTVEHSSQDHIEYMKENGLLSKEDLPALRAIAKCEKVDVSELDDQYKDELEHADI